MSYTQQLSSDPIDIFIEGWGRMGTLWGVGKVMGEIQALLYLHRRPLSLEEMSERLKTSRSNISLNVRALQDLGVVKKVIVPRDRKDYYTAEGNLGRVARRLAAEKKKRELDPALKIVHRAIEAAESAKEAASPDPLSDEVDATRLHELKHLMEVISDIFDTFIVDEPLDADRREAAGERNP